MERPSRRSLIVSLASATLIDTGVSKSISQVSARPIAWDKIRKLATDFVDNESPAEVWPFERTGLSGLSASGKRVFVHYFTPFPLSIENGSPAIDYYSTEYLQLNGEGGKFAYAGGYIRERPLPVGPWHDTPWLETNLAIEILRAQAIGVDGFGVDILTLPDASRYWAATAGLYDVAEQVAPKFKILAEPDTDALKGADLTRIAAALTWLARKPAAYHLPDGRFLLAPFDPVQWSVERWDSILRILTKSGVRTALIPILLNPGLDAGRFRSVSDGMSEWGQRDTPDIIGDEGRSDWRKTTHGAGPNWMQPVSPQDFRPKAAIFWEAGNTDAFRSAWMRAIDERAPFVHIITWNDYSEGTEISPSTGIQYLFYDLSCYFLTWWKTDRQPKIVRDAIYYCYRRQILSTKTKNKPALNMNLLGNQAIENNIEMIALVTEPATMQIEIDKKVWQKKAIPGLNILKVPSAVGRPTFRIVNGSQTAAQVIGKQLISRQDDNRIDALYYGGSSTRDRVRSI